MALVPQVVDAVRVPVIAAGGIADARGIVAALALGASAVQVGTAYLLCPEARISSLYRQALKDVKDNDTAITNVFTGRPARGIVNRLIREIGPISDVASEFPLARLLQRRSARNQRWRDRPTSRHCGRAKPIV
jgi:nitronate monooxygenase